MRAHCPKCKASFKAGKETLGKNARCKRCKQVFVVDNLTALLSDAVPEVSSVNGSGSITVKAKTRDEARRVALARLWKRLGDVIEEHVVAPGREFVVVKTGPTILSACRSLDDDQTS